MVLGIGSLHVQKRSFTMPLHNKHLIWCWPCEWMRCTAASVSKVTKPKPRCSERLTLSRGRYTSITYPNLMK